MGPAFESFLTIAFPIAVLLIGGGYVFRDQIKRVGRYFVAWKQRDEKLDQEEAFLRLKAEDELKYGRASADSKDDEGQSQRT